MLGLNSKRIWKWWQGSHYQSCAKYFEHTTRRRQGQSCTKNLYVVFMRREWLRSRVTGARRALAKQSCEVSALLIVKRTWSILLSVSSPGVRRREIVIRDCDSGVNKCIYTALTVTRDLSWISKNRGIHDKWHLWRQHCEIQRDKARSRAKKRSLQLENIEVAVATLKTKLVQLQFAKNRTECNSI